MSHRLQAAPDDEVPPRTGLLLVSVASRSRSADVWGASRAGTRRAHHLAHSLRLVSVTINGPSLPRSTEDARCSTTLPTLGGSSSIETEKEAKCPSSPQPPGPFSLEKSDFMLESLGRSPCFQPAPVLRGHVDLPGQIRLRLISGICVYQIGTLLLRSTCLQTDRHGDPHVRPGELDACRPCAGGNGHRSHSIHDLRERTDLIQQGIELFHSGFFRCEALGSLGGLLLSPRQTLCLQVPRLPVVDEMKLLRLLSLQQEPSLRGFRHWSKGHGWVLRRRGDPYQENNLSENVSVETREYKAARRENGMVPNRGNGTQQGGG